MNKLSRKLLSFFVSVIMVSMLLPGQTAKAAVTSDGVFEYEIIENNKARILGLVDESMSGHLEIPSTITDETGTYNVTAIGYWGFDRCYNLG